MEVEPVLLSNQGPSFSRLVAGAWRWENHTPAQLAALIEQAVEIGITTFDHADIYGGHICESLFGEAFTQTNLQREAIQLVSKCGIILPSAQRPDLQLHHYDTRKEHIILSAENSLKALKTEYLDLLLIHRPDPLMNPTEIAEAFARLQRSGKVRFFGVSNFSVDQFEMLNSFFPLVTNQIEISPLHLDAFFDGTLNQCQKYQIKPMAWSPFGGGKLFDENPGQGSAVARVREEMMKISDRLGDVSFDQLALSWLLMHPVGILPILGTGKIERFRSAAQAKELTLTREDWFRIWIASTGYPVP